MNKKIAIILGAVVTAAIILVAVMFFGLNASANVKISATLDKDTYNSGEEINLILSLNNSGDTETCVSDMEGGSIQFTSFTRDGESVETRSTSAYYITSYPEMLESSLVALPSGQSLDSVLLSLFDNGLGKRALTTTSLDDGRGLITFYNVETPGNYELELVYKYTGPVSPDCTSVFKGKTNSASVMFTVTP